MAGGPVTCHRCGCRVACSAWRQCPIKGCGVDIAACEAHGGDHKAMELMWFHIAIHQPPTVAGVGRLPWEWTGPRPEDWAIENTYLLAPVPPDRWPYGPPDHHEAGCRLQRAGLFCDCLASAADDTEWGNGC